MKKLLKVRFPDGSVICRDKKATDTYIDTLVRIGLPAVNELNISARDNRFVNLVSDKPDGGNCTEVGGWYVFRKLDAEGMAKYLTKVSDRLGLGLGVDIVEKPEAVFRSWKPEMKVVLDGVEFCRNSCAATFAEAVRRRLLRLDQDEHCQEGRAPEGDRTFSRQGHSCKYRTKTHPNLAESLSKRFSRRLPRFPKSTRKRTMSST